MYLQNNISPIRACNINRQNKSNGIVAGNSLKGINKDNNPSFKRIIIRTPGSGGTQELYKSWIKRYVAVRETLTKVYTGTNYYELEFSVPTIKQMLDCPEKIEIYASEHCDCCL